MKLTEINKETLTDEEIEKIVYSDIIDTGESTTYGIVFGNSMLIKERVESAVLAYQSKRITKVIFTGGRNGISNEEKDGISEAQKMKALAIQKGIKESDIITEEESNNTFENIDNTMKLLKQENISEVALITSEFHLKRCMAIIKKKKPNIEVVMIHSRDGFSDSNNWFLSDNSWNSGRSLATYEANLLIKYAKENKIADIDITDFEKIRESRDNEDEGR